MVERLFAGAELGPGPGFAPGLYHRRRCDRGPPRTGHAITTGLQRLSGREPVELAPDDGHWARHLQLLVEGCLLGHGQCAELLDRRDGAEQIYGDQSTWQQQTYTITGSGTHTLKWTFTRSSDEDHNGAGYVDAVQWTGSAAPAPEPPVNDWHADVHL